MIVIYKIGLNFYSVTPESSKWAHQVPEQGAESCFLVEFMQLLWTSMDLLLFIFFAEASSPAVREEDVN